MISIVHIEVHLDDFHNIMGIQMKLKCFPKDSGYGANIDTSVFIAAATTAFYNTTLMADVGKTFKTVLDPKRKDVIDFIVTFQKNSKLDLHDIANFIGAFKEALNTTTLI